MLSEVLSLDKLSCSQIWNIEQEERQRKRESERQASKAQREKGRQGFIARDKKQNIHFFVGRTA